MHFRSGGIDPGRDGCRVPLPWSGTVPPFGFSPAGARTPPWLPQPADWAALTVQAQQADPSSMLWLYRQALRMRRVLNGASDTAFSWRDLGPGVLAFDRGSEFLSVTNLSAGGIELPHNGGILLSSSPLMGGLLPPDSTAWLRTQHVPPEIRA
jgi:alpha-glucosidase